MEEEIKIVPINPDTFETQEYNSSDRELLTVSILDTAFSGSSDYIELAVYDENQNLIEEVSNLTTYTIKQGDVLLDPQQDLINLGFDVDSYFTNYTFYRKRLSSSSTEKYYISNISSDRTEIEITSNQISETDVISSTNEFIQYRENANYFVDFYLNFGDNQTIVANNIKLSAGKVLIKLYETLPSNFDIKSQLWVVEEISTPQAYKVTFPSVIEIPNDFTYIQGPNFGLQEETPKGSSGDDFSYSELTNTPLTSSYNEILNLLEQKEIEININYENFGEFIHFSSAQTRLENFYYKVGLIESASLQISDYLGQIPGATLDTVAYSESKATLSNQIEEIIKNFDGYERFLYYDSGSLYSYPKSNDTPPYNLYSTGSTEVLNWLGSADPDSAYYGGIALSASNFDQENKDWLYWTIPQYLRDDPENAQYELFVDMMGQHYDNIWIYIKDVSKKFNADNRLQYGISKDLVAQAIRDFNVKLYANNFNRDELYTAFLGLTPSGSLFPFPDITDTLPANTGSEYIDTKVSSSNDAIPLDDVNKRLYKRIYHNIPYLLKTKGTHNGLRALLTSYGIPDTILRINEFGGSKRHTTTDRNLEEKVFNYAFDTEGQYYFSSSFAQLAAWEGGSGTPNTVQFRFKTPGIPTTASYSQSLWSIDDGASSMVLEYTGSAFSSGSYSGSVVDPYNTYATLKFVPDSGDTTKSASLYLPFFDGGWWSVMTILEGGNATLYAANSLDGDLKFTSSDSVSGFSNGPYRGSEIQFPNSTTITIASKDYEPFSGSLQEIRYFSPSLSESVFHDYTLNPYSFEGNTINSAPNELIFRADLGTQLDTGSRTSIHPKVTGSANYPTASFTGPTSDYFLSSGSFVTNKESVYLNALATGIKDRATVKVALKETILPENPSGSNTSITVLSPLQSLQQTSPTTESFTDEINYVDISLSPQDQINDDIIAQLGNFNIGDYIGDPRQIYSASLNYPDLDTLRDDYFEKYIKSYDLKDFVRLIKYFDNSLFKMIKDFTPARTSLTSGVTIKQHILERNRSPFIQNTTNTTLATYGSGSLIDPTNTSSREGITLNTPLIQQDLTLSGSIKPQSRNYNTGSGDVGAYEYTNGSSIYKFSGGTGGSFERYNTLSADPYYQSASFAYYSSSGNYPGYPDTSSIFDINGGPLKTNRFFLTQSYSESIQESINDTGSFPNYSSKVISDQREFYDGEFSGSYIVATTQSLNPGCAPYLKVVDTSISYNPLFFPSTAVNSVEFSKNTNNPNSGDAWIYYTRGTGGTVNLIKLSSTDASGIDVTNYLQSSDKIEISFPDFTTGGRTSAEYYISGVTPFANSVLLAIDQTQGDIAVTGSEVGGSENWSLRASGSYSNEGASDDESQGVFTDITKTNQSQTFVYWNGGTEDAQGFFNTGSSSTTLADIKAGTNTNFGGYAPSRTSNIPWFFSCSLYYSASGQNISGPISTNAVYHSQSSYSGINLTDQSFNLTTTGDSGIFVPSPKFVNLDSSYFTSSYNTQIPGNSGSGFTLGGHPQIKTAGTGSIDFYFPYLTLSGSGLTVTADPTPFSGSTFISYNGNFATQVANEAGASNVLKLSAQSASRDGAYHFNETEAENFKSNNPDGVPGEPPSIPTNVTLVSVGTIFMEYELSHSIGLDISASMQYGSSSQFTNNTQTTISVYRTASAGSGVLNYTPKFGFSMNPSNDGNNALMFRPVLKSTEADFGYYLGSSSLSLVAGFDVEYDLGDEVVTQTEFETFSIDLSVPAQNAGSLTGGFNSFTSSLSTPTTSTVDIQVNLKVTGSDGDGAYERLITSSNALVGQDIYEGVTFTFPDSPILNIINSNSQSTDSDTTITRQNDMYFIEYSMSNFTDNADDITVDFLENGDTGSKIILTHSFEETSTGYNLTASVYVEQFNSETGQPIRNAFTQTPFIIPNTTSSGFIEASGSFTGPFNQNDIFRLATSVQKNLGSGLTITSYTMSLYPSTSIDSVITESQIGYDIYNPPISTNFIVPTFFGVDIEPFDKALDCQPTLNNYINGRKSSFLMDVDYSFNTGSQKPQNFDLILNNNATKAETPDSNYTNTGIVNSKYDGAKSTSQRLNVWTPTDRGTYGKSPTVESRNAFFAYYNSIENYYPLLNDTIGLYLNYLIDKDGNAIPPSLEGNIFQATIQNTFQTSDKVSLSLLTGSKKLQILNDEFSLIKLGVIPTPILYSQDGGQSYSTSIPISSSRRISLYDNDDTNSFYNLDFISDGGSHDAQSNLSTLSQILNPSSSVSQKAFADGLPYTSSNGVIYFHTDDRGSNNEPSQEYLVSLDTLLDTSFLRESGEIELEIKLALEYALSGSFASAVNIPPTLEDIELYVLQGGESKLLGSVAFGEDDVVRYVTGRLTRNTRRQRRKYGLNKKDRRIGSEAPVVNKNNEIEFVVENYAVVDLLKANGYNTKDPNYTLQWRIKANSGENKFEQNYAVRWKLSAFTRGSSNVLFPGATPEYLPTRIKLEGNKTHLYAGDYTGSAPYWVFTGSAGGGTDILSTNILVMSASNINEAYGEDSFQGILQYTPGATPNFPLGVEPAETQFPEVSYPLVLYPGDEIRFGNNENYSYRIKKVTPPQENVEGDGKSRLKIELDNNVPASVVKDFFLVRRYIPNANSMLLDAQFPYLTDGSGSNSTGIAFPPFPAIGLENSASAIIVDLTSKGIIT